MKFLIQRVKQAQVDIAKETVGKIGQGLLVLIGIGKDDSRETAERLVKKDAFPANFCRCRRQNESFATGCRRKSASRFSIHPLCGLP